MPADYDFPDIGMGKFPEYFRILLQASFDRTLAGISLHSGNEAVLGCDSVVKYGGLTRTTPE